MVSRIPLGTTALALSLVLAAGPAAAAPGGAVAGVAQQGLGLLLVGAFVLLLLLPFGPALKEVLWPRDDGPIPLDRAYARDARYLGRSARAILARALGERASQPGIHRVTLSREEDVRVERSLSVPPGATLGGVLYVDGHLEVADGVNVDADVVARAWARLGRSTRIRSLAADGAAVLGTGCRVVRWIDTEGDLVVAGGCDLGQSAASHGALRLGDGTRFRRLAGQPVVAGEATGPGPAAAPLPVRRPVPDELRDIRDVLGWHEHDLVLAPGGTLEGDQVVRGDLRLGRGATLGGSARVYGEVVLEPGAQVLGDLFADGDIRLGEESRVAGNVFSQSSVGLGPRATIGRSGATKSLVARRAVMLGADARVHGVVVAEGGGRVSRRDSAA